jgi:hypothetical protein
MAAATRVLTDASTAHGAGRYFTATGRGYDRALYADFLRQVLIYEDLAVVSSRTNDHSDVDQLVRALSEALGEGFLELEPPDWDGADETAFEDDVLLRLCALITERASDAFKAEVGRLRIPRIYDDRHEDAPRMRRAADEVGMELELLPYALFCFRGLCYAGMGASLTRRRGVPTVYAAAPGRLSALRKLLDGTADSYVTEAYASLVARLSLPSAGYSFIRAGLPSGPVWDVVSVIAERSPPEALRWVAEQRQTHEGLELRQRWAALLCSSGTPLATGAVGAAGSPHATQVFVVIEHVEHMESHSIAVINSTVNAPIVLAESIKSSFNRVEEARLEADAEGLFAELHQAVASLATEDPSTAEGLVRDLNALTAEATAAQPRRGSVQRRLDELKDGAAVIGATAAPILDIVSKLAVLL